MQVSVQQALRALHRLQRTGAVAVELFRAGRRLFRRRQRRRRHLDDVRQRLAVLLIILFEVIDRVARARDVVAAGVHIDHETRRRNANQHQHNQADAFLAVVGAVRVADADCRDDQGDTRPERRLFLAVDFFAVSGRHMDARALFGAAPVATQQENQAACDDQTDNRRQNQRQEDIDNFGDIKRVDH